MFKKLLMMFLVVFGVSSVYAAPKIGEVAPNFKSKDTNNKNVELSKLKGKYVVLEWTNHDCPYVRKHYDSQNMQKLQKEFKKRGAVWISVISSAPDKQGNVDSKMANELTKSRDASPSHVILDPTGEIGRAYSAKATPHMYLIDKNNKLVYMGAIDSIRSADPSDIASATNYLELAYKQASSGKPVEYAVTKAYGCSVKY